MTKNNKDVKDKIIDKESLIITITVIDPHHNGEWEWGMFDENFYQRRIGRATWSLANRVKLTPSRIKMFNKLLNKLKDAKNRNKTKDDNILFKNDFRENY